MHRTGPSNKATCEPPEKTGRTEISSVRGFRPASASISTTFCRGPNPVWTMVWGQQLQLTSLFPPVVGEWQEGEGQLLSLTTPHRKKGAVPRPESKSSQVLLVGGWGGEEDRVLWPWVFPKRLLAVPVKAAHWEADSRPPVEGCTLCHIYQQIQVHMDPGVGIECFSFLAIWLTTKPDPKCVLLVYGLWNYSNLGSG